jgi:ATP-dependent protease HslVU (ClpYQ) peptidase subunit
MTLIVGVKCSDGIVLGADSAATFGTQLGQQNTIRQETATKLHISSNKIVIAVSGPVSLSQSYGDEMDVYLASKGSKVHWKNVADAKKDISGMFWKHAKEAWQKAEVVARVAGVQAAINECNHASAAAFAIGDESHLIQFSAHCNAEEVTQDLPFAALGSGQPSADPFLAFIRRIFWPSGLPSLIDGQIATVWTLDEVIKTNPGGVGGAVKVAVLKKDEKNNWRCELLTDEEIDEHRQLVADIERRMREAASSDAAEPIPPPPEVPQIPS